MRICLYTSAAIPSMGGQEMVVHALATHFTRAGHDVVVLAPRPRKHLRSEDEALPYPVVWHPRYFSKRWMVEFYGRWLGRVCRRHRPDIVHCHGIYPPGYLASRCCPRLGIPFLITSHGEDVYAGQPRMDEPLILGRHVQALAAANGLVAVSRFTHEGFRRLCPKARLIADIPNGVDVDEFARPVRRPPSLPTEIREKRYFLAIGRLVRQKGLDVAIKALAELPPPADTALVVAGDGAERPGLQELARALDVADKVHFLGRTEGDAKAYLLQNSLALVVPSRGWEAFGLVVLESYAAGRPVIASRLPGMADLVEPDITGWLVAPESVEELARAFTRVQETLSQRTAHGSHTVRFAKAYTWAKIAEAHLNLYGEVASSNSPSR